MCEAERVMFMFIPFLSASLPPWAQLAHVISVCLSVGRRNIIFADGVTADRVICVVRLDASRRPYVVYLSAHFSFPFCAVMQSPLRCERDPTRQTVLADRVA